MSTLAAVAPTSWEAWKLDAITWTWIAWMLFGLLFEIFVLVFFRGQELTAHLRPVFQTSDLAYFTALGFWLGIGYHFLVSGLWIKQWGLP